MRPESKKKSWNFFQLFIQSGFTINLSRQRIADRYYLGSFALD